MYHPSRLRWRGRSVGETRWCGASTSPRSRSPGSGGGATAPSCTAITRRSPPSGLGEPESSRSHRGFDGELGVALGGQVVVEVGDELVTAGAAGGGGRPSRRLHAGR